MFHDLSHTIVDGQVTYPGLPAPQICDFLSRSDSRSRYRDQAEFHIGRIDMVANTGTYVDAPFHRFADGIDLAELPLERLADLPTVVVDASRRRIGREAFDGLDVRGRAVLLRTGWWSRFGTDAYADAEAPFLDREAAAWLREQGAALVGIDGINLDALEDLSRPAHTLLLGGGIPICEHLCGLESLPQQGARFFAVPPKVRAFGTFPVRAFAIVGDRDRNGRTAAV